MLCALALLIGLAAAPAVAEGGKALKILFVSSGGIDDGNVVLTSALKVMHLDVERQLNAIYDGTFVGRDALLGSDTDSTGYVSAEGRQQLSEDMLAKLAECYDLIKKGEIVPPTSLAELQ